MWVGQKIVTCWERHLCFVVFSKTHFQQNGFKRGETAKYVKVTRQSWPMLSRRCICLETFEELHLHASDCLHLSFFRSLFLKPSHFCLSEDAGSSLLHPPLYIFFAFTVERNAHWRSSVHSCWKGSGTMGRIKTTTKPRERTVSGSLCATKIYHWLSDTSLGSS